MDKHDTEQVNADELPDENDVEMPDQEYVNVKFTGVAWTRRNPVTGKITRIRKGAILEVTAKEYAVLGSGPKPTLSQV